MKLLNTLFLFSFIVLPSIAQDDIEPYIKKYFTIVASTKDYNSAKRQAMKVAEQMDIKLDLRDLHPTDEGLSFPDTVCLNNGWEAPCYVARGRWDDGEYVSIEWSDAFSGFSKGYYIVVVSSGDDLKRMKTRLNVVKRFVSDAYIKSTDVYIGCMH